LRPRSHRRDKPHGRRRSTDDANRVVRSWRLSSAANRADGSMSRPDVVARRVLLLNGGYCSDPRPRGVPVGHMQREPSVTVARAERKSHHQCLILFCRHTAHASRLPNRPCSRDKYPQRGCRLLPPCGPRIGNQIGNRRGKRQRNGTKNGFRHGFRSASGARTLVAHVPLSHRPAPKLWPPSRRGERRGLRQAGQRSTARHQSRQSNLGLRPV